MDSTGHVKVSRLCSAVESVSPDWGLSPSSIRAILHPERLFSGAIEDAGIDEGDTLLSKGELLGALDARAAEKRVCREIQLHLLDVKRAFHRLNPIEGPDCTPDGFVV
jgi:hypothetical protein